MFHKKQLKMCAQHNDIGREGEEKAALFLEKNGFRIRERNYWKKWGEIDIIAQKDKVLHFVEVKSVSRPLRTSNRNDYEPEDNVHPAKLKRLSRTIQTYLLEHNLDDVDFVIDVLSVFLGGEEPEFRFLEDIII